MDEFDMLDIDYEEEVKKTIEELKFNPEYIRNRNHSYLEIYGSKNRDVIEMLSHNKIKGLLPITISSENGLIKYRYEITSLISLNHWMNKKKVGMEEVRLVLSAIYNCTEALEEFFLDLENLVLMPEYIFVDEKNLQFYFLVFDGYEKDFTKSLKELIQFFLEHIDSSKRREASCIYAIYEVLQNPNYCFKEIMEKLYEKKEVVDTFEPIKEEELEYEEIVEEKKIPVNKILAGSCILAGILLGIYFRTIYSLIIVVVGIILLVLSIKKKETEKEIPILEDEDCEEDPETTILKPQSNERVLKSVNSDKMNIIINGEEFIIGKVASVTNAQIDSRVISRMHAKIYKKDDEWKIVDLLSTNGTYLNGKRLKAEEEYSLKEGDKVRFADLEYVFY